MKTRCRDSWRVVSGWQADSVELTLFFTNQWCEADEYATGPQHGGGSPGSINYCSKSVEEGFFFEGRAFLFWLDPTSNCCFVYNGLIKIYIYYFKMKNSSWRTLCQLWLEVETFTEIPNVLSVTQALTCYLLTLKQCVRHTFKSLSSPLYPFIHFIPFSCAKVNKDYLLHKSLKTALVITQNTFWACSRRWMV